ncbi:sigma-70 family RNA polymerase sigma factor [Hyalangium versicolor]|uniref:sigma-70 family RNA polymerase sigma factor n=1 Tax=Hyalangium versicolor TaxID=2861190 RepID=UPI001CCE97F0|nr:sigma-70 family RNA polymerase sigma factor [Hyalangium versicolor]
MSPISPSGKTFEELLRRSRAREKEALEELLRFTRKEMEAWAAQKADTAQPGGSRPSDIYQETAIQVVQHFASFQGFTQGEWFAWVKKIISSQARQLARDAGRKKRAPAGFLSLDAEEAQAVPIPQQSPSQLTAQKEEWNQLDKNLALLPAEQREACRLHHLEELTATEVAKRMGKSKAAVESLLQRGLKKLRELSAQSAQNLTEPTLGLQVGEYSIVRKAAVGATSELYEGSHRSSGAIVAVKVLRPKWCRQKEIVARFLNEAHALQELQHPHLVRAMAKGTLPQGAPFMILEWLPTDLHQLLTARGGRLQITDCSRVLQQLASALESLHAHGLIHRDLKPANVLVSHSKPGAVTVKLADLGLAKHTVGDGALPSALPVSTAGSALLGTWDYMAPEQWVHSKTAGPKADVYSLGVLGFQLLTGRLPFIAGAQGDLMTQHLEQPPPLELLPDSVPTPVRTLLSRMLSKKASERPTPRELQEILPVTRK